MRQKGTTFMEAVSNGPLTCDGAMGTQLYAKGVFLNRNLEEASLSNPLLVRNVHEQYITAGADLIESHTFGANRIKLERHGLGDKLEHINRRAIELALEAANGRAYVGGAIGPTGVTPGVVSDAALEAVNDAFREQALILASNGADVIVLETFRLLSEMRIALRAVRQVCDLPVICQMAFDADERTSDGAQPFQTVEILRDAGADIVGANCVEGPKVVFSVVEKMVGHGVPIIAQPNAGYPRHEEGRMIYMATPEYFGVYSKRFFKAGVSIVGGCCGTGDDHIAKIAAAARMMGGGRIDVGSSMSSSEYRVLPGHTRIPTPEKTGLAAKVIHAYETRVNAENPEPISPDNFVVSVEVNPPSGLDPQKALAAAKALRDGGVDVINIADGPRASVRMSNQALALLMQNELDIEVILHMCCRDRNLLGLQSDLLANHVLGIHNLVVITGDPPKMGDYPHATAVFDLDSIGLLRVIDGLNRGVDPSGKMMDQPTRFFCACGAEPAALDYERELRRLEAKRAAGAEMIMTQPVYDPAVLRRFLDDIEHLEMPVMVGLLPLASYRNAEFLHNEVPGMRIPDHIRERMSHAEKGPAARAEGVKIAQEALTAVIDDVVGAYIMPPFGRYSAALEILEPFGFNAADSTD